MYSHYTHHFCVPDHLSHPYSSAANHLIGGPFLKFLLPTLTSAHALFVELCRLICLVVHNAALSSQDNQLRLSQLMSPPLLHDECATRKFHLFSTGQQRKNAFVHPCPSTSAQTHLLCPPSKRGLSGARDGNIPATSPFCFAKHFLQHNGHFRDRKCRFRHPLTPLLTALEPPRAS